MFEKRPKLSFFILGMFFGALCGGILVYYNSVITNENKISVNLIPQIVKQVIGVINNKSENTTDSLKSNINISQNLTTVDSTYNASTNNLTEYNNEQEESMGDDTISNDSVVDSELIRIKKEELLASKELNIYSLENNAIQKQNKNDSLLAIVSGTKDESKKAVQQKIMVELWKSPINYKGYHASKNKIIIYGFSEMQDIKLFSNKNNLLLKHNENVYYIDYNNDFNSYEKVTDALILSQINNIVP
jgi:hypothetical protein